ncbi:hypothetical protein [Accumulibacter sp.]|uniref:Uncharacterized protein n=1 Tax=Accumulibacter regalis TaxID=522306 RepID=C7RR29_ACCRE|nr:hypothetical protein [Accumulibacter sp.]MBN8495312.1 hypothetical protein [Accumulibacter sp.]MBO3715669.1 hypothetical protein [Accumulibacter sp.]
MSRVVGSTVVVVWTRLEALWRVASRGALAIVGATILQTAVGLSGVGEVSAGDRDVPPLTTYPSQVFTTEKPGQLGLYVEGEDWHLLADMPGFEHQELPFSGPSQFFFMGNDTSGTTATVFAERIDGANSEESCRRYYARGVQEGRDRTASFVGDKGKVGEVAEVEARGKTLLMYDWSISEFGPQKVQFWRRTIYWYPYYRGFCFDFHFSVSSTAAQEDVLKVFDSVTYGPRRPSADIDRLFYFFDRLRIRLSIPIDWRYTYRRPPPGPAGGIELRSGKGQAFSFLVFPLGRTRSAALSDQPEGVAEAARRSYEERGATVSSLQTQCAAGTCVYYYDLTVRADDSAYAHDFRYNAVQYHRQGWAKFGEMVMGLSLLYGDSGKDAADHVTAAFSRAKVLDLGAARRPAAQGDRPPTE